MNNEDTKISETNRQPENDTKLQLLQYTGESIKTSGV